MNEKSFNFEKIQLTQPNGTTISMIECKNCHLRMLNTTPEKLLYLHRYK